MSYSQKLSLCRILNNKNKLVRSFGFRCSCYRTGHEFEWLELYDPISLEYIQSSNCIKWDERTIIEWFFDNCLILHKKIKES